MKNKKLLISIFFILIISISFITYSIYDDKRNNIPDSVEKIIPKPIKDFLIKNIFYKRKRVYNFISEDERIRPENVGKASAGGELVCDFLWLIVTYYKVAGHSSRHPWISRAVSNKFACFLSKLKYLVIFLWLFDSMLVFV